MVSTNIPMSSRRGFTLIELLVVIAIIGILSSVVLASLGQARMKGRDARRISDLRQIQIALELYNDSNGGEYPDDDPAGELPATIVTGGQIAALPEDPTGSAYSYYNLTSSGANCTVASGACVSYIIGATMEMAVPAGDIDGTQAQGNMDCSDNNKRYCIKP